MKFSQLILTAALVISAFIVGKSLTSATSPSYAAENQENNSEDGVVSEAYGTTNADKTPFSQPSHSTLGRGFGPHETGVIDLFESAAPSVVFITTTSLKQRGWSMDVTEIPQGTGTGFMWDNHGHIVTNFHVLEGGNKFTVMLSDQTSHDAEVVGYEPSKDLAVLKIKNMGKIKALPIGTSSNLKVGQFTYEGEQGADTVASDFLQGPMHDAPCANVTLKWVFLIIFDARIPNMMVGLPVEISVRVNKAPTR